MTVDWREAIHYGKLVKIAESVQAYSEYEGEQDDAIAEAGYEFLETIYGSDLATDVDPHLGDIVTFGFLAVSSDGELVAVLRGTETILEWVHDAEFLMVPSPVSVGLTDDGFTALYKSLRLKKDEPDAATVSLLDYIKACCETQQAKKVMVCGHSLGGALATLLTLHVAKKVLACSSVTSYTFASPRVGDHVFVDEYKKAREIIASYRIANNLDLVTKLPTVLPLPYEHVEERQELGPDFAEVEFTISCMHHMSTYLYLMGQLVGDDSFKLEDGC